MRKFKTAEAVNEMLVKQYEVARLNSENDVSTIQILQQAKVPDKRSKPRRGFIIVTSTCTAFLFALVFCLVTDRFGRVNGNG